MENSKVLIEFAYKKYTNKSKYRFSWVWHALSFAFPTLVYWLASAVVFLLCGWYSFYHQEYVEEVGLDAWALAYTTFGVLLSLIVIVATRDLKFFGKSFFSLFKAKFVSPRNYLSSFLYWSLALFVYCLVEFLLGNKGALFCGSFILFVVSVICILMLFFDLARPLDRYWLSFFEKWGTGSWGALLFGLSVFHDGGFGITRCGPNLEIAGSLRISLQCVEDGFPRFENPVPRRRPFQSGCFLLRGIA